jgi:hypothetical protein
MLTEASKRTKDKPCYFAYAPGGKGAAGLVVSPRTITTGEQNDLKKAGGGRVFVGRVYHSDDATTVGGGLRQTQPSACWLAI